MDRCDEIYGPSTGLSKTMQHANLHQKLTACQTQWLWFFIGIIRREALAPGETPAAEKVNQTGGTKSTKGPKKSGGTVTEKEFLATDAHRGTPIRT